MCKHPFEPARGWEWVFRMNECMSEKLTLPVSELGISIRMAMSTSSATMNVQSGKSPAQLEGRGGDEICESICIRELSIVGLTTAFKRKRVCLN